MAPGSAATPRYSEKQAFRVRRFLSRDGPGPACSWQEIKIDKAESGGDPKKLDLSLEEKLDPWKRTGTLVCPASPWARLVCDPLPKGSVGASILQWGTEWGGLRRPAKLGDRPGHSIFSGHTVWETAV